MNINLQLKEKWTKKKHSPASRHLRMPGTKLKTVKFDYI